jgi:hypothetical protein
MNKQLQKLCVSGEARMKQYFIWNVPDSNFGRVSSDRFSWGFLCLLD